jgi:TRAP-type C4-dicarboxylate transport system substrate-binding protein
MKRAHIPSLLTAAVFSLAFVLAGSTLLQAAEKYQFMAQSVYPSPEVSNGSKAFLEWMTRVEAATDGQVTFKKFYGHQLVGIKESLEALQKGTLDVLYSGSYWTGNIPESNFMWLPFYAKGSEFSVRLFRDTLAGRMHAQAYAEHGAQLLAYIPASINAVLSTKPIHKVGDFKGLKLRSGSTLWNSMWKKMGASPVMLSGAEQYTALQRGTIDATVYPIYTVDSYNFHEVIDYVIMPGILDPVMTFVWINKEKWDQLTPRLQTIINQTSLQFEEEYAIPNDLEITDTLMQVCKDYDVEVIRWKKEDFSEWRNVGEIVWKEFAGTNERCEKMAESLAAYRQWWEKSRGEDFKAWEERWLAE